MPRTPSQAPPSSPLTPPARPDHFRDGFDFFFTVSRLENLNFIHEYRFCRLRMFCPQAYRHTPPNAKAPDTSGFLHILADAEVGHCLLRRDLPLVDAIRHTNAAIGTTSHVETGR